MYCSALHFTPRQKNLWKLYKAKRLSLGNADSGMAGTWSPCLWAMKYPYGLVESVAFSPNDTQVVSGSSDSIVCLWDAVSGAHLNTLIHSSKVFSVAFSPNGTQVVSGSDDQTLCLWDAANGAHLNTLKGHSSAVLSVAFSPNGTKVVSGSDDQTLCLWDAISGAHCNTLKGHSSAVLSVAFSPNGTKVVSGSYDMTVCLWDAMNGAHFNTFKGHSSLVASVAFSPNGTQVVSGSSDCTVCLWDAVSGIHLNTLRVTLAQFGLLPSHPMACKLFLPNGTQVMSRFYDGTFYLWDAVSGRSFSNIYTTASTNTPAWLTSFTQTCCHLIVADDGWIYLRNQKQCLCWIPVSCRPPYGGCQCLAFKGTYVVLGSYNGYITILDLSGMQFCFFNDIICLECSYFFQALLPRLAV